MAEPFGLGEARRFDVVRLLCRIELGVRFCNHLDAHFGKGIVRALRDGFRKRRRRVP